ncbi:MULTISPECIES: YgaP family membrane protein [Salinibaculum]|uniref:YgaP family membrane protein n=1 Tax=Salinibaculum TaxID=2732368 RepID=UPI0030CD22E8
MDRNVGGRDRIVRALLTAVLTTVAVSALRGGKRKKGLLTGIGALILGFTVTTGYCGANEALGIDTAEQSD